MTAKTPKFKNLKSLITECLDTGCYLDTLHLLEKRKERRISRSEILYVLRHGYHEKRKDHYEEKFRSWNYAIRGITADRRNLRIIISFERNSMFIITAIDLDF